jgi:hypothetical protein
MMSGRICFASAYLLQNMGISTPEISPLPTSAVRTQMRDAQRSRHANAAAFKRRVLPSIAVQVRKDHSLEYCKLNFCRNTLLILARRTCTSAARRQTWIGPWVVGATGLLRYLPRPCETGIPSRVHLAILSAVQSQD